VHLDATLALFWLSLGISTAAVVLFVWLIRDQDRETGEGKRETNRR